MQQTTGLAQQRAEIAQQTAKLIQQRAKIAQQTNNKQYLSTDLLRYS
ncbi:hypothetical protein ACQKND_14500 [Viridibacillus arvi]